MRKFFCHHDVKFTIICLLNGVFILAVSELYNLSLDTSIWMCFIAAMNIIIFGIPLMQFYDLLEKEREDEPDDSKCSYRWSDGTYHDEPQYINGG